MTLDDNTFEYLKPTQRQGEIMADAREASRQYAEVLEAIIPDGPDKTYLLRKVREAAMWANIAITREADGSPRK